MAKKETPDSVRIFHKFFPYYIDREDPVTGRDVRTEQLARRGEDYKVVDDKVTGDEDEPTISLKDWQRGERLGAFMVEPSLAEDDELDPATASIEELASWIKTDQPKVQEVIDASDGDADTAKKLLEAEKLATGNQPRATLVQGLAAVVERANQ
jgi:hypothetical protein